MNHGVRRSSGRFGLARVGCRHERRSTDDRSKCGRHADESAPKFRKHALKQEKIADPPGHTLRLLTSCGVNGTRKILPIAAKWVNSTKEVAQTGDSTL
jgi:hypothetical protein